MESRPATLWSRWPLLAFGLLTAFLSNFGQTFFVALFNPQIRAEFDLSHGQFGALYSAATLGAGLLVVVFGALLDRVRTRTFTLATFLFLAAAAAVMANVSGPLTLLLALFMIRFGGQSLMTMISTVTMARYFSRNRGSALAIAALGYPFGELVLPLAAVVLIAGYGWRAPWLFGAVLIVLAIVPMLSLLRNAARKMASDEDQVGAHDAPRQWTRGEVVRDVRFALLMAHFVAAPFILTGLFFHQAFLAGDKGWTLIWLAQSMIGFGAGHLLALLVTALIIDRIGAARLLPWINLPLLAGLVILATYSAALAAPLYLTAAGLSMGAARNAGSAAFAEIYGVAHLGAIRGVATMLVVLAVAAAPVALGWLIDAGVDIDRVVLTAAGYVLLASAAVWLQRARFPTSP